MTHHPPQWAPIPHPNGERRPPRKGHPKIPSCLLELLTVQTRIIAGELYTFADRYCPGDSLGETEAAILNDLRGDSLAKQFAAKLRQGAAPESFQEYAAGYNLAQAKSHRRETEIQILATTLAANAIKTHIRKSSTTPPDKDWLANKAEQILLQQPAFLLEARRRIEAADVIASQILADLELA